MMLPSHSVLQKPTTLDPAARWLRPSHVARLAPSHGVVQGGRIGATEWAQMRVGGWWRALPLVFVLAGCSGTSTESAEPPQEPTVRFRAGAASAEVSPEPGLFIAGDARNRRFAGAHDPLFAKAVLLHDGATALAIVTVDNIGLTRPDIEAIRQRAATAAALPELTADRIVVSSTHTHSGPDVVGMWGEHELASGRDAAYMERLVETAAAQVAAAAAGLRPATLRVASGLHDLPWVENVTEPGLLDRQMGVLQFVDEAGRSIATLTNFACHPTVMDAVSDQVSSDYVAGFYRVMSERLPGEHMFLQGAIGGWVQPDKTGRSFTLADAYGADVADRALALLDAAERNVAPRLRAARREFLVPLENPGFAALLEAGVLQRPLEDGHIRTEVALLEIGEAVLVTHPGETSPQYSLDTRALIDRPHSFVLGLAGDALGYILKPEYFEPGAPFPSAAYLTATSIGPETGPLTMENVAALTGDLDR
jgi:hypothetical protein